MDFFKSIPAHENGLNTSNTTSNSSCDKAKPQQSTQPKRSVTEFQSVTGGLLEEVVGMINASTSSNKWVCLSWSKKHTLHEGIPTKVKMVCALFKWQ